MTKFWPPNHAEIEEERAIRRALIMQQPEKVPALRELYRTNPAIFIEHWSVTIDPRSIAKGRSALVPFVLWPRQRELIEWMYERWKRGEPGTVVKSRDVGASWLAMALLGTMCLFERNFAAGVVSATEVKLDRVGDPDTLFYKLREFLRWLPPEFNGGYIEEKHSAYLRVAIPMTGSSVVGSPGPTAGRGGRQSITIVDESAHLPQPKLVDAALAATTDCRIDLSSVNGTDNSFYERAHNPNIPRFDIGWRDDPRRSQAWYDELCKRLDAVTIAQEYDCNWQASTPGQLIQSAWIQAAVGAHLRLGIYPTGERVGAYDPADQGDRCAFAGRHGILCEFIESWHGKGSNPLQSTLRAVDHCRQLGYRKLVYDAAGLGGGVSGYAEVINAECEKSGQQALQFTAYSGASSPPDGELRAGIDNRERYANAKAHDWDALAKRFEATYRAVVLGEEVADDDIISLDPWMPELRQLVNELGQVAVRRTPAGKLLVDKYGDGSRSPNLGDALCMAFANHDGILIWEKLAGDGEHGVRLTREEREAFVAERERFRRESGNAPPPGEAPARDGEESPPVRVVPVGDGVYGALFADVGTALRAQKAALAEAAADDAIRNERRAKAAPATGPGYDSWPELSPAQRRQHPEYCKLLREENERRVEVENEKLRAATREKLRRMEVTADDWQRRGKA